MGSHHPLCCNCPNTGWGSLQGLGWTPGGNNPLQLPQQNLLEPVCQSSAVMAVPGSAMNSSPLAFITTGVSGEHGKSSCFLFPPYHNLQDSDRDNLKGLSAFSHKGSSRLTCLYQCPACLGSIVQKTHFHLSLTMQKLICRSNGLHLSICPAAVYCACM